MIMAVHGLSCDVPSDLAITRDRIRARTMGAENVLHDLGVIPITSSDAQGMGRAGETVRRTFALAATMKRLRGADPDGVQGHERHDNERVLRYLAKLTINPAVAHGLSHEVGSVEVGKLADIVLWDPARFAAVPQLVLKAGFPAWGVTGDPNAAVDDAQPQVLGPQYGGHGAAPAELSVAFVSGSAHDAGDDRLPTRRRRVPVAGTRGIGLDQMNRTRPSADVRVAPDGVVTLDDEVVHSEPVESVPLSRLYFL
jgi:urease subunit alpha